ncbi:hypothetical protein OAO18_08950, partial [Francisellaceae bacterium]|nr:hypothetical protein [Francisellaceae bacterium]
SSNPDIDVHGKIRDYVAAHCNVQDSSTKNDILNTHLAKTGDALYKSSNSAKKVSMQTPKFMSADRTNDFFTVKLENNQYQLTHLDPAAPYRRYVACIQNGQNNIFTDIWHKLCDAALAVIKRIKQAINAIVNMLNKVLGAIADLGIPGISDLAKIAKGVVSFLGAVINAALDYMAAFINMLKYLFDFKRAQDIGIQVLELLTAVSGATQVKSFSMDKQKLTSIDTSKVKVTTGQSGILEKYRNDAHNTSGKTNSRPENMNHIHNTMSKHESSSGSSSVSKNLQGSPITSLQSDDGIMTIVELFSSVSDPASVIQFPSLLEKVSTIDFTKIITQSINGIPSSIESIFNDVFTTNIGELVVEVMGALTINKFLGEVLSFILGVTLKSYKDIMELLIGYPLMLLSELLIGTVKGICNDQQQSWPSEYDKIEGMLDSVIKLYNGQSSTLFANSGTWKKDALVWFNAIYGAFENVLDLLQTIFIPEDEDEKKALMQQSNFIKTLVTIFNINDYISGVINWTSSSLSQASGIASTFFNVDFAKSNDFFESLGNGFDTKGFGDDADEGLSAMSFIFDFLSYGCQSAQLYYTLTGRENNEFNNFKESWGAITPFISLGMTIAYMSINGEIIEKGPQSRQYLNDRVGSLVGNVDDVLSAVYKFKKTKDKAYFNPDIVVAMAALKVLKVGSNVIAVALPEDS